MCCGSPNSSFESNIFQRAHIKLRIIIKVHNLHSTTGPIVANRTRRQHEKKIENATSEVFPAAAKKESSYNVKYNIYIKNLSRLLYLFDNRNEINQIR